MKITSVRSFLLSFPFPEPVRLPFYGGERTLLKRDAMFVRVEADNGLVGYAPGPGSETVHRAIGDTIAPFLEGRVLADPDALRVLFLQGPGADPESPKSIAPWRSRSTIWPARPAAFRFPNCSAAGSATASASTAAPACTCRPEAYAAEAAAIADLGFRAYKMRPAAGPEQDLETVRLMRKAVGPDFDLMVDAHTWWRMGDRSYSLATVEQLAQDMAAHRIAWLEEPLPPDDHAAYLALKEKDLVPLASGEHEPNEERYLDLILTQAVDYVQMDVCCQGGYSLGRRLFAEIARQGLRFAFHSWGTALEVAAAAHLGICWPQMVVEWLEYPCYSTPGRAGMYPFPLAAEILTQPLEIERGDLIVPRTPGLGVTVDERVIERYPWIPGPWSLFRTDSPAETRAVTSDHSVQWDAAGR